MGVAGCLGGTASRHLLLPRHRAAFPGNLEQFAGGTAGWAVGELASGSLWAAGPVAAVKFLRHWFFLACFTGSEVYFRFFFFLTLFMLHFSFAVVKKVYRWCLFLPVPEGSFASR